MLVSPVPDAAGRRRSPMLPGYHAGRPPRNKGSRYPADPPTVEELIAVMRQTLDESHGFRLRALIIVLWRGGLRSQEALALGERDLDARAPTRAGVSGNGGRRREIGMDAWGWEQLPPCLAAGSSCRSARCSESSTARLAGGPGRAPSRTNAIDSGTRPHVTSAPRPRPRRARRQRSTRARCFANAASSAWGTPSPSHR